MAKIKTAGEADHNRVSGSLQSFLEGGQNLKWFLGVIESSEVRGVTLDKIFENYQDHGDRQRYEEAVSACRQREWLP